MHPPVNESDISKLTHQLSLARNEINNLRQQLTSLKHAYKKDVEQIKESLKTWTCSKCVVNNEPAPSSSNAENSSQSNNAEFPFKIIGHVETSFNNKRAVPRQPGILSQSQGIVRIDNRVLTNPQHALEGLHQFSHMWILFYFHRNESTHIHAKVTPPRLNGIRTGVFASRSPHRPSPIGLSLVKVDSVQDECILFSGVDMIDGTPVLDIKPFIPQYDSPYPSQLNIQSLPPTHSLPPAPGPPPLRWQRLPTDSDSRSEDGDLDLQHRLLIGESNSSTDNLEIEISSDSGPNSANIRILDGRDSDDVFLSTRTTPIVNQDSYIDRSPTIRSASQREAPEGSEGGSPPSPIVIGDVRVADWINNAPVFRLSVQIAEDCMNKITRISETQEASLRIQSSIISILSEDPRSVYVRERYNEDPYECLIEGLNVTCFFDDISHVCLVTNVDRIVNGFVESETTAPVVS